MNINEIINTSDGDKWLGYFRRINRISPKAKKELIEWLINHESDIAHGINDFGDLKKIFIECFEREPKP